MASFLEGLWPFRLRKFEVITGIPSKRKSSARIDYVPALCTHRPSLLPIEWSSEVFGSRRCGCVLNLDYIERCISREDNDKLLKDFIDSEGGSGIERPGVIQGTAHAHRMPGHRCPPPLVRFSAVLRRSIPVMLRRFSDEPSRDIQNDAMSPSPIPKPLAPLALSCAVALYTIDSVYHPVVWGHRAPSAPSICGSIGQHWHLGASDVQEGRAPKIILGPHWYSSVGTKDNFRLWEAISKPSSTILRRTGAAESLEGPNLFKERLDRFLISEDTIGNMPFISTMIVRQSKSDHEAILLNTLGSKPREKNTMGHARVP
ncbi:hypothetical protein GOBAR_AA09771 [Gossypium barbadense]|uniref:Uncharacterized protein n=1 Tax=Gossypium barbadense TaxID=3634 RepID=A0A2P5Y5J9_GOSBA|nr:hypothetical protein GOBAR_AA09771 [Gossypium barbadense]